MDIVERGKGPPLVIVPSLHGRWEYFHPAIDALARSFRVMTYSLPDTPAWGRESDAERALDSLVEQLASALVAARIDRAAICGISFGGMVAVRFAARHPDATSALVLVSTPGPLWRPSPRHALYARWPRTMGMLFFAEGPWRLWGEVAAALPHLGKRGRFLWGQLRAAMQAPLSPASMAARARLIGEVRLAGDCARIAAPTLVVTGEPSLDRVVPVNATSQYLSLIRSVRLEQLPRTGHLGCVTRPDLFQATVKAFLDGQIDAAA